jgi:hypothetical protein
MMEVTVTNITTEVEVEAGFDLFEVLVFEGSEENARKFAEEAAESAIAAGLSEQEAFDSAQEAAVSAAVAEVSAQLATAERRSDFVDPISYIGKAPGGTLENQPLWTISKIVVDVDGTTVKTVAVDVAWTDRLTAIYS